MYQYSWVLAAMLLMGCAVQETERSGEPLPQGMPEGWALPQTEQGKAVYQQWWQSFGSVELTALMEQAQHHNFDIAVAMTKERQADARLRYAQAERHPLLQVDGAAMHVGNIKHGTQQNSLQWQAAFTASYEPDFWGRLKALKSAAEHAKDASAFEHATVQLTTSAAVAQAWFQTVGLRDRVMVAAQNLEASEQVLRLVAARARHGAANSVELAQQRSLVAGQKRMLAKLRMQAANAQEQLALLCGQWSLPPLKEVSLLHLKVPAISAGTPLELITRRPDVAKAEALLAAAHANLAAARAAVLPRITLTASIGGENDALRHLLSNPLYTLVAGLTAPIFDAGRLAAQQSLAQAQQEELLVGYRQAVVQAFNDVQMALNAVAGAQRQFLAQQEEVAQARQALALAEVRYKAGAESLQTLLDVQRTAYSAQEVAIQMQQERLVASVALYKALGGGWRVPRGPV